MVEGLLLTSPRRSPFGPPSEVVFGKSAKVVSLIKNAHGFFGKMGLGKKTRGVFESHLQLKMNLPIEKVKTLYYQKGLSTREVGEKLSASVWQVIKFMKKNGLPRRKASETQRLQFLRKPPSFKIKKNLSNNEKELLIAGIMLYWAEGNKQKDTADLANSDPEMIKLYLSFLRRICQVNESRLKGLVYCYANQSVNKLENYWSRITSIPKKRFFKTYVRKDYSEKKNGKMKYGLVHVRYSDQKLVIQINDWINQFSEELTARIRK